VDFTGGSDDRGGKTGGSVGGLFELAREERVSVCRGIGSVEPG
jgi:hypothetical protein